MAQIGKVKLVNSGDSLLLQHPKTKAEKTFSLAYVSAPRLKRDGDEVSYNYPSLYGFLPLWNYR